VIWDTLTRRELSRLAFATICAIVLCSCASIRNEPLNIPLAAAPLGRLTLPQSERAGDDDVLVGLAFSGGGTRAAAFSYGVLSALDGIEVVSGGRRVSLFDDIDVVSGVSGGSVTAAYFGLKGRAALADFRERFLLRDAEDTLRLPFAPASVVRAYEGGVNDSQQFPQWLDANLFDGATFADLDHAGRPLVLINASDIYNRTPFVFSDSTFRAICSDLKSYPISDAVAASAAVPVVFAPIIVESYGDRCPAPQKWFLDAQTNPAASPLLKGLAGAFRRYRDGSVRYIKLLDGGLVDNYGLSGVSIARLSADTPYGPLTPQRAIAIQRLLFLVVDAGRGPSGNWAKSLEGPTAPEIIQAAADTAIDAGARSSFTAFNEIMSQWRDAIIRWRCGLSAAEREKYAVGAKWDCRDLKFFVGRIGFEQLGFQRALTLSAIPTRFSLSREDVKTLIAAGEDALRESATLRAFVGSVALPNFRTRMSRSPLK